MWVIRREIKQTARMLIRKNLNLTMKIGILTLAVFMLLELVSLRLGPSIQGAEDTNFAEYLFAISHMEWQKYLLWALLWLIRFIIVSPLVCAVCAFALELTQRERVFSAEKADLGLGYILRFYTSRSERSRAFKLRVAFTGLSLMWKLIFCGGPAYLILTLRAAPSSLAYANALLIYSLGLLLGYLISYIIEGRYYPAFFIIAQEPDTSVRAALREAVVIMKGHAWEFFKYKVSFLPWYIFSAITFGVGLIYVIPLRCISDAIYIRYCDAGGSPVWEKEDAQG